MTFFTLVSYYTLASLSPMGGYLKRTTIITLSKEIIKSINPQRFLKIVIITIIIIKISKCR